MTGLVYVDELRPWCVSDIKYNVMEDKDLWRVNIVLDIIDMMHGQLDVPEGWDDVELKELLGFVCTS